MRSTCLIAVPFPAARATIKGMTRALHLTQDEAADALLSDSWLALLIGMLLDQQIPMEQAFRGPRTLAERLGGLDAGSVVTTDPDVLAAACAGPPAVHRFPGSMANRIRALCGHLVAEHGGAVEQLWTAGEPDAREVLWRLRALPGFGEHKAQIFLALLGKQCGVRPTGWREAAGRYGEDGVHRSIADVVDARSLEQVRADKKQAKAAAKR